MTIEYSVTYEFATRPPLTHRGTATAGSEATCFARAIREAKRALRPIGWTSVCAVALGRVQPTKDGKFEAVA